MWETFRDGALAEECMWQTFALIQKGKEGFQGIGLVEVLWKAFAVLLNGHLTAAISFHDTLHGFWKGQGTVTTALEAKLLQHLTAMREAVIFEVFLYIQKAYNALDRERALDLLVAYEVGPRMVRLLRAYWDRLTMMAKAGGYFGRPFKGYQCVP